MSMFTMTFAAMVLAAATAAPQPGDAVTAVDAMFGLPFGQPRSAVLSVLQSRVERRMLAEVRDSNDPVQRERIRKDYQGRLATLTSGYTATERGLGPYRLAPIRSVVAVGAGAGVVRETTSGEPRWLLFFGDKLYGAALTLPITRPMHEQVQDLSGRLGRIASTIRKNGDKGEVVAVRWTPNDKEVQLKDLTTEYGVVLLTALDAKAWKAALEATNRNVKKTKPDDSQPAEDILKEFLP
jgi:hypothetical protein